MGDDNNPRGCSSPDRSGDSRDSEGVRRRSFLKGVAASSATTGGFVGAAGRASADVSTISNDHLTVFFEDESGVGTFTMQTADGRDLMFAGGEPGTSYLTVRVDGTSYVTLADGTMENATSMDGYVSRSPTVSDDGRSVRTSWTLPEDVAVTQTITLQGEAAAFEVAVENEGAGSRTVDLRYLFDYQVDEQDGSPVFVDGEVLTSETRFESPAFSTWQTYDRLPEPDLTGRATVGTRPTVVDFVEWEDAVENPYEYEHSGTTETDSGNEFYTPGETSSPASDTAGLLYWESGSLASGDETSVVTYYGTGEPARTALADFERALEQFQASAVELFSTAMRVNARTHAELYAAVGEPYRDNLVNYVGYKAGTLSADEVDSEIRTELDELVGGLPVTESADELYRFFDRMFGSVDPETDVEEIQRRFEEHLRGTTPDQSATLTVGDSTILDDLVSCFQETFDSLRREAVGRLSAASPPPELVANLVGFVENRTADLRRRETELIEIHERIIADAKEGNRHRIHNRQVQMAGGALVVSVSIPTTSAVATSATFIAGTLTFLSLGAVALRIVTGSSRIVHASRGYSITDMIRWLLYQTNQYYVQRKQDALQQLFDQLGETVEAFVEEHCGVDIEIITGLQDLALTMVELLLTGIANEGVESARDFFASVEVTDVSVTDVGPENVVYDEGTRIARGSGSVTIRNSSSSPVTPYFVPSETNISSFSLAGAVPLGVPVDAHVVLPAAREMPTIRPGESETVEFEYLFPLDVVPGVYEFSVGVKSHPLAQSTETAKAVFFDTHLPDVAVDVLGRGSLVEGAAETFARTFGGNSARATFVLDYPGSDLDLHLYDENDDHVGVNYETGAEENQISGATWSGPDGGGGRGEGIVVTDPRGSYSAEVVAVETDEQGSEYAVTTNQVPELPATMQVVPNRLGVRGTPGTAVEGEVTVEELAGFHGLTGVSLTASDLAAGDEQGSMPAGSLSFDPDGFDVPPGDFVPVSMTVDVPDDAARGTYAGTVTVDAEEATEEVPVTVAVERTDEPSEDGEQTITVTTEDVEPGFAAYFLTATGELTPQDDSEAVVEGSSALGWVGPESRTSTLEFTGEITRFLLKGQAAVELDVESIDATVIRDGGSDTRSGELPRTLTVTKEGARDGFAGYAVTVSGDVARTDGSEATVQGTAALDWVGPDSETDTLEFSGEIEQFLLGGPAVVSVDGQQVDPGNL